MPRHHDVGPEPVGRRRQRLDVPVEVGGELAVGEIDEPLDLEPLVLVDHEHRQQPSDVGPEENGSSRRTGRGPIEINDR